MKAQHKQSIKGSTVIIIFMYLTWVAYILGEVACYIWTYLETGFGSWLPSEVTYGTAALFIGETVSLARLKMAKEGMVLKPHTNRYLENLGIYGTSEFEEEAQEISTQNSQQETSSESEESYG